MTLSTNDHAVLEAVQILGQVTTDQLLRLVFSEPHTSPASRGVRTRRTLRRLYKAGMIDRLGMAEGGFVYTPRGSRTHRIDPHELDLSELYIRLAGAEMTRRLKVLEFSPREIINQSRTKSDAYLWIEIDGQRRDWYLEIDRGSEYKPQLKEKARAYTKAAKKAGGAPKVLYVVSFAPRNRIAERVMFIRSVIREAEFPEAFEVCTLDEVLDVL